MCRCGKIYPVQEKYAMIHLLKNPVQEYAWGSRTAIAELLGNRASEKPQAELWMGAHPKAPSMVHWRNEPVSLDRLIEKYPDEILGKAAALKFRGRLPYLFKVLAAGQPLSIQAHPDLEQARKGFAQENRMNIPLNAPKRNYKDDNHKPECICALTDFWALKGFRDISAILSLTGWICPEGLRGIRENLKDAHSDSEGLKNFFQSLMNLNPERREKVVTEAVSNARLFLDKKTEQEFHPELKWIIRLHQFYPSDIGVLAPLFLHLICLKPGQALFLPAGELHSYLEGTGIELMANSDNVLRGGLTPKHVDVPELMKVLRFAPSPVNILLPRKISEYEQIWPSEAEEFALSLITVRDGMENAVFQNQSAEILLCTQGKSEISESGSERMLEVGKGMSVLVTARKEQYQIRGNAVFCKASVPPIT